MMAEFYIVTFLLLFTIAVLWWVVPWIAQKTALYGLHELRDRIYDIARANPWARDTLFYRDAEFILVLSINVVRDCHFTSCAELVRAPDEATAVQTNWRDDRYAYEFAAHRGQKRHTLRQLASLARASRKFIWLRLILGHPAMMAIGVASCFVALASLHRLLLVGRDPGPPSRLKRPTERLTRAQAARTVFGAVLPRPA